MPETERFEGAAAKAADRRRREIPVWAAVGAAMVGGLAVAVQTRINGALSLELGDGVLAAALSFGSGLALLLVLLALSPARRREVAQYAGDLRAGRFSWTLAIGGLGGAALVLSQGLVAGIVGVALFTVAVVAGQTVGGVVIDLIGLGPAGRRPLTLQRGVGALLTLVAVGLSVADGFSESGELSLLLLPLASGLLVGWQQAVNGRVTQFTNSAFTATLGNFVVGVFVLGAAAIVHAVVAGGPRGWATNPLLDLGGAIGVCYIFAMAIMVKPLGVLLLAMSTVAGQVLGALAIDAVMPAAGHALHPLTVIGGALTVVAIGVASLRPRARRERGARSPRG